MNAPILITCTHISLQQLTDEEEKAFQKANYENTRKVSHKLAHGRSVFNACKILDMVEVAPNEVTTPSFIVDEYYPAHTIVRLGHEEDNFVRVCATAAEIVSAVAGAAGEMYAAIQFMHQTHFANISTQAKMAQAAQQAASNAPPKEATDLHDVAGTINPKSN